MKRSIACALLAVVCLARPSVAGPYSSYQGTTAGAPDNPIARSAITLFESEVVGYAPAPGVGPNFRSPTTSLTALGELHSPVAPPGGTNTPFDPRYQPQAGTEPSPAHNGAIDSPFGGNVNDPGDSYGFIGLDAPGSITLGFGSSALYDGPGADFAVFENGFGFGGPTSIFAELAYVEVSSNGTDFARFASISLNTAPTIVSGAFQGYDATNIHNLAGKHASNWGTPFDLSELAGDPLVGAGLLDLSDVRFVRLVDVVGSGTLLDGGGSPISGVAVDSLGNPILDNWLTFDSAGFDYLGLPTGAVGAIHAVPEPSTWALLAVGASLLCLGRMRSRHHATRCIRFVFRHAVPRISPARTNEPPLEGRCEDSRLLVEGHRRRDGSRGCDPLVHLLASVGQQLRRCARHGAGRCANDPARHPAGC